jgi:ubiquitin-conjugating enzyme E2 J2
LTTTTITIIRMATDICTRRLTKELKALHKDPLTDPVIRVAPNERNILEMHYVIEGSKGTAYEGGVYHGKLLFPKEYPLKPPGVMMMTPSGRFQEGRRLCLSMSDFHPETWNPMWSVSTILQGLYSFMIETKPTMGSLETSYRKKRQLAAQSLEFNVKGHGDALFPKLFPEYVERYYQEVEEKKKRDEERAASLDRLGVSSSSSGSGINPLDMAAARMNRVGGNHGGVGGVGPFVAGLDFMEGLPQGLAAAVAGIVAVLSIAVVYRFC